MSKITDLGSPDRELSARDIKRKQNKLRRTEERLKKAPAGTRQRHRLEFKKLKTEDQIKTGMSGIRPVKKPFKVSHHADLQQEKKFNAPVNNYKEGYYGVERKSALNMLGITDKKPTTTPPLTDEEKKRLHAVSSINYSKVVSSGGVDLGTIKSKKGISRKSPLKDMTEQENDSIAAVKAWDTFKSGYMNRTHKFKGRPNERPLSTEENQAEYDREKNEFYYDSDKEEIRLIPTDDAERQDEDFLKKLKSYQLPPQNN